jgi:hypothetical protein
MKKIAFLFLIYDQIQHEEMWHLFFKDADPEKYTIRVHYKTRASLKYFESYKLKNCIATNYVIDTTIAKAHNLLIEEALNDQDVYKTVNLSQSCIPLKSFDHVYDFLTRDESSHFNLMPMSDWSLAVTGPALAYLRRDEIHKAANWFILNRTHATTCLSHLEYLEYFKSVHSPEEFLYITLLKKYAPENITYTHYSAEGATTFTNWDYKWGMVYKFPVDASIKHYSQISEEELTYLMESPCLFGRKFNGDCKVDGTPLSAYPPYRTLLSSMRKIEVA